MNFLIFNLSSGGAERVVSLLANQICKSEPVTIYVMSGDVFYSIDSSVRIIPICKSNSKVISLFMSFIFLYKQAISGKLHSIQSHMFYSNYIAGLVALLVPSFKVTMVHCVAWDSKFKSGTLKRYMHVFFMKILYKYANRHIFKSKGMENSYRKIITVKDFSVIYNPIRLDVINRNRHVPFSHNSSKIKIVSVGRFHRSKRQNDLLDALLALNFDFEVIFLGDGSCLSNVKEYCVDINLDSKVKFLGNVKNPFEYYRWADIYVSCSESEGFPNSLIEALGCGCVAIHSDCISGPDEILKKDNASLFGENVLVCQYGLLYPVGNVSALSSSIKYAVEHRVEMIAKSNEFYFDLAISLDVSEISKKYLL